MVRLQITDYRLQRKIFILFSVLCSLFSVCFAQSISSSELINNARQYDGKTITYEGEVIGDIMKRGKFAWLNVNDGEVAIGVWAPETLIKDIKYTGSYKSKGDWIRITGIFNRACSVHAGELDIHAESIEKISSGKVFKEKLIHGKKNLAIILLGVCTLVWILTLLRYR